MLRQCMGGVKQKALWVKRFKAECQRALTSPAKSFLERNHRAKLSLRVRRSIGRSLDALKLDRIDLFFLHSKYHPRRLPVPRNLAEDQHRWSVTEACFYEAVVPRFETIQREGLIGPGNHGYGLAEHHHGRAKG